ncbi:hypothetical protein [Mycobacterium sp. 94-17]|uniref:hypothetical protein n=1 Tax=Mycobacterium sp. 94-17 TaxID=2986147 RepID=UPI002D1EC0B5|nr:hypothetical protein [Mycobacterium sp. 94-17]MEB4210957.1 hypothetical protein [Mycobacterium sp. 94-17]
MSNVLSVGDAIALGDLLTAIQQKRSVRWVDSEDSTEIRSGELRSLVVGPNNFAFAPWGTDVRDMHVWVTSGGLERTFPVAHAIRMIPAGGMAFD